MIRLTLQDGTQRHLLVVDRLPARIGRARDCEVRLPADPTVSRVHAVISNDASGLCITDAGSRNGTYLNGLLLTGAAPFTTGNRVRVGPFILALEADDDQQETVEAGEGAGGARARVESGLSVREVDVVRLLAAGRTDREIAEALVISVRTVHSHLERIRDKTGCRRRTDLVRFALDHGLA